MWSRCNPTEAVDTHRHSGNSHTFLSQNGTYTGIGPVVTNPVWSSARKLAVRVSAHSGNRVRPMRESNTNHRANTRSQSNSESVSVSVEICRTPRGTNNFRSPNMVMDRSTGCLALPRDCPRPAPYRFERCGGLVVCEPEIPNAAVRCRGIPPREPGGGCQSIYYSRVVNPVFTLLM